MANNSLPPKSTELLRNGRSFVFQIAYTLLVTAIVGIVATLILHHATLAAQQVQIESMQRNIDEIKADQRRIAMDTESVKIQIGVIGVNTQNILKELQDDR